MTQEFRVGGDCKHGRRPQLYKECKAEREPALQSTEGELVLKRCARCISYESRFS